MHILILGAGYAGLRTAIELDDRLHGNRDAARITLIDRNLYHQHIVLLHLAATGSSTFSDVAIPLDKVLARRTTRLHPGTVRAIRPLEREVALAEGLTLTYDRLVIALGAQTNYAAVRGARDHCLPLRSLDDATRMYEQIERCFAEAARTSDTAARRRLLSFVVVGGGFTGVQLAGELAHRVSLLCWKYHLPARDARIVLLERGAHLLRQFGPWATRYAERVLRWRGVDVRLHTSVVEVDEQQVTIAGQGVSEHTPTSDVIPAATVIWAGGIRGPDVLAHTGLPTDEQGRLRVDRYLRVHDQAYIFALGDSACVPDSRGQPVAATASYAMRQGEHLATVLLDELTGRAPRPYRPQQLGELVSLGPGEAVGNPLGVPTFGLPAATLKVGIEQWYLTTLEKIL